MPVSKTQIDHLGDRLKSGNHTKNDLELLDAYRRSFGEAYQVVIDRVREFGAFPTGRPAKSTVSIAEKLRRESIRLSQIQDIAGCRIVVRDVVGQDQLVEFLKTAFPQASIIDRRENHSHGYRAVHVIVKVLGKPVEIQVRSYLQHLWAGLSEKASDVIDPAIKYGGGPEMWRELLAASSQQVWALEGCERMMHPDASKAELDDGRTLAECLSSHEMHATWGTLSDMRDQTMRQLDGLVSLLNNLKRDRT